METGSAQFTIIAAKMKAENMLFRISSGSVNHLTRGETVRVQMPGIVRGSTTVTIKGQSVTIEGLPKQIANQVVMFMIKGTQARPVLELLIQGKQHDSTHTKNAKHAQGRGQVLTSPSFSKGDMKQGHVNTPAGEARTKNMSSPHSSTQATEKSTVSVAHTANNPSNKRVAHTHISSDARARAAEANTKHTQPSGSGGTVKKVGVELARPALIAGTQIQAVVSERLPSGAIALAWRGQTMESSAPAHVKKGDVLLLHVHKAGKYPVLSVKSHIPQAQAKLDVLLQQGIAQKNTHVLSKTLPPMLQAVENMPDAIRNTLLGEAMQQLLAWVDDHAVHENRPLSSEHLARIIRDSGIHYESKLAQSLHHAPDELKQLSQKDLKALMMRVEAMQQTLADVDDSEQQHRRLPHDAGRIAAHIETLQAFNANTAIQGGSVRMEFPLMMHGQMAHVRMEIRDGMEEGGQQQGSDSPNTSKPYHILFSMELSGLGMIRIDAGITPKSVQARFYSGHEITRHFIHQQIPVLETKLGEMGYAQVQLSSFADRKMPEEQKVRFEKMNTDIANDPNRLDIRA